MGFQVRIVPKPVVLIDLNTSVLNEVSWLLNANRLHGTHLLDGLEMYSRALPWAGSHISWHH